MPRDPAVLARLAGRAMGYAPRVQSGTPPYLTPELVAAVLGSERRRGRLADGASVYARVRYCGEDMRHLVYWLLAHDVADRAAELDVRLRAGEIAGWEPQYRIECIPYDCHGTAVPQCKVTHRVDFRVHELDGSYTLVEAKGMETDDYKRRRKWLEHFWLPAHPDHNYEVVRMSRYRGRSRGGSFRG